jgi:hypothetical protein
MILTNNCHQGATTITTSWQPSVYQKKIMTWQLSLGAPDLLSLRGLELAVEASVAWNSVVLQLMLICFSDSSVSP